MIILFCVAIWLTSGFIAAGWLSAHAQRVIVGLHWSSRLCLWLLVFGGPITIMYAHYYESHKHGWRKWW